MQALFSSVLNMSITASVVMLVVVFARFLLKGLPKKYSYALWSIAAFRLCCPFSFKSVVSIFNINPIQNPSEVVTNSGSMNYIDAPFYIVNPQPDGATMNGYVIGGADAPVTTIFEHNFTDVLPYIWFVGVIVLLIYGIVNYFIIRNKLTTATKKEKNIYQSENITSPFILGIIKPKIYVPYSIDDEYYSYIIAHEKHHLKRCDNVIKFVAFILLCVHWFNPLCWVAFYLMNKDMEMSCDEWVLAHNEGIKKAYSNALLSFAFGKNFPKPSPLCFGEGSAKSRIKNILKYKKPAVIISVIAIILCVAIAVVCVANPKKKEGKQNSISDNIETVYTSYNDQEYFDEQFETLYQKVTINYSAKENFPHYPSAKEYQEYKNILSKKDKALKYVFDKFNEGRRVNIKGELMIMIFQDLIGDEQIKCDAENGQDYFNAWVEHNENLFEKNDLDFMKKNYPCGYLYLTEYLDSKTYDDVAKYINFFAYVYDDNQYNTDSITFSSFDKPRDDYPTYSRIVRWQKTDGLPNVKSAKMIAEQNGKNIYIKELEIEDVRPTTYNNATWDYVISYDNEVTIKCDVTKPVDIFIIAVDENGVNYKINLLKTAYNSEDNTNLSVVEIVDGDNNYVINGSGSIVSTDYGFIFDKYWYTNTKDGDETKICCHQFCKDGTMKNTTYSFKNGKCSEIHEQYPYYFDDNNTIVYDWASGLYSKAFIQFDVEKQTLAEYDRNTMNDDKSKQKVLVNYIPYSENSLEIAKSLV